MVTNISCSIHYCSIFTKTEKLCIQLQDESDLIVQFHSELNDLQLWMSDTLSMLHLSAVEGPTSVAQLRGKHQVCINVCIYT